SALDKFERRTALIEAFAREHGIVDPDEKGKLGAKTRERKKNKFSFEELREVWGSWLTGDESEDVRSVGLAVGGAAKAEDREAAVMAVAQAIEHCFERKSVVPERTLLANALKSSVGKASVDAIEKELQRSRAVTVTRDGRRLVTLPEVLGEESR